MIFRVAISVFAFFAPILSLAGTSQDSVGNVGENCRALSTCTIEYDHLATQESDPFLLIGYVMNSEQARWSQYRRAMKRFRDVRSCLIEEEKEKNNPNLLLMDWQETGTGRGAEVCIFLIARSLGSIERHQQWLTFHKFRVKGLTQIFTQDFTPDFANQVVSYVSGFWTTEQYRALNSSWFSSLTGLEIVQGYQVRFQYSDRQLVVGVRANTRSK